MNANRKTALGEEYYSIIADIAGFADFTCFGYLDNPDYLIQISENRNQVIIRSALGHDYR